MNNHIDVKHYELTGSTTEIELVKEALINSPYHT